MESWIIFAAIAALLGVFGVLIPISFRRVVSTNDVHIVQSSKETKSYGKGTGFGNTYYEWPSWIPVLGVTKIVLPVSNFDVELTEYEAFDKGRLQFIVDVVAFFRIVDSNVAAQRISSFEELRAQLTFILKGAIRTILASSDIEEIMQGRSTFGDMFTNEVKTQLANWGVETVKNIELMDLRDAKGSIIIKNIMEKKKSHIEMESRQEVAKNMQQAEISEIEAKRQVDLQREQARQVTGLRKIEADQLVQLSQQTSLQAVKEQEKVTKAKEMEVLSVEHVKTAEIKKAVELVNADKAKQISIITAQGELESRKLDAEAQFTLTKRKAEGDFEANKLEASAIALEGKAKADAESAMKMAPVTAQIALAKEIGGNEKYQTYLITVDKIKAQQAIGIEQAKALSSADIKIIATGGDASSGMNSAMDLFTPKGGVAIGAMIEGMVQNPTAKALVETVTGAKVQ